MCLTVCPRRRSNRKKFTEMPFTLAHPAIVLPFGKKGGGLSLTALVAGSIVPDFEFFLQLREVENVGHHWYGILVFDLPLAALFCLLYHHLLRNALVIHLPAFLRNRLNDTLDFNWYRYALQNPWKVLISLLLGIASHLFWDAFTHADGFFVERYASLTANLALPGRQMPVYFFLQLVFSVAGSLAVIAAVFSRTPHPEITPPKNLPGIYWPVLLTSQAVIFSLRVTGWPEYNSFWGIVMALLGSAAYALLLTSLLTVKMLKSVNV